MKMVFDSIKHLAGLKDSLIASRNTFAALPLVSHAVIKAANPGASNCKLRFMVQIARSEYINASIKHQEVVAKLEVVIAHLEVKSVK